MWNNFQLRNGLLPNISFEREACYATAPHGSLKLSLCVARIVCSEEKLSRNRTYDRHEYKATTSHLAFLYAHNTGQTGDFNQLFTVGALVTDEAHEYQGGAAIEAWIDAAMAKYKPVADVTDLAEVGEQTIATAQVSGNFPGSPAQIRYKFTLRNEKIAALAIGT